MGAAKTDSQMLSRLQIETMESPAQEALTPHPMSETIKHDCCKAAWNSNLAFGKFVKCKNNATVERDGKWYCGTHDPVKVAKRNSDRAAKWKRESEIRQARWNKEAKLNALGNLVKLGATDAEIATEVRNIFNQ